MGRHLRASLLQLIPGFPSVCLEKSYPHLKAEHRCDTVTSDSTPQVELIPSFPVDSTVHRVVVSKNNHLHACGRAPRDCYEALSVHFRPTDLPAPARPGTGPHGRAFTALVKSSPYRGAAKTKEMLRRSALSSRRWMYYDGCEAHYWGSGAWRQVNRKGRVGGGEGETEKEIGIER